ncbi:hypothetical protein Tco_0024699 [Tanacetum coccineum]
MTIFPEISRRARDKYHNLKDDDIMKNIFNSGRHKDKVGMQIPAWMISEEMKQTEHYRDVGKVFGDRCREEQEAKENVALVDEHLASEEIEKMVEGPEKCLLMIVQSLGMINSNIPGTRMRAQEGCYGYLFAHLRARFMPRKSFDTLADNLHDVMVETLPTMVDKHIKEQVMKQVPEQVQNQVLVNVEIFRLKSRHKLRMQLPMSFLLKLMHPYIVIYQQYQLYLAMKADPQLQQQDIAIWLALQMKFEERRFTNKLHWQCGKKTSECELYVSGESIVWTSFQEEQAPSTSGNQEQDDDFDFWTNSYASDDDEIPTKQVSYDIMEEVLLTIDEAKLRKMADEMLRHRCNFMKMSNQVITLDSMKILEEWTLSGRRSSMRRTFYIRKQKEPGKPKEEVYSNSKIIQVVKTYWELGHEHKFITEIVARRANKYHYNNDIKYGYVQKDLTKDEVEYLKLFEERLKHRRQMRRWEMFMNGRPLDTKSLP